MAGQDNETAAMLRRAGMQLARRLSMERGSSDVSGLKLALLGHLWRTGPMSAGELAARERQHPQSLTRALAALEHEGFVRRGHDQRDKRQHCLEITDAGRAALAEAMQPRDAYLARGLERLTPTERELLRLAADLLAKLAADEPAPPAEAS